MLKGNNPYIKSLIVHKQRTDKKWMNADMPYNQGASGPTYQMLDEIMILGCINDPKFKVLSDLNGLIVLDSGAGMGSSYAKHLQERHAKIISLDLSEYALKEHWLFPRNYETFTKIQGDFFDLPFKDTTIDVVVAYYFMADNPLFIEDEQVKKESFKRYISEVERVLIKDGVFIAFDPRILTNEAEECKKVFSYTDNEAPFLICAKK